MRAGDEVAFEALYDRFHADLLAFCRHMLGSREEAEDALQHVFVAAHRHLRASEGDIRLRPWLYTIARNRCLSVLRARRLAVPLEDVAEPEAAGLAVASEVEQRQDLKDLLSDLARLPDDQRAALVLAEIGALPHDEIAVALDVRREKVKALVFQARESLLGWREARNTDCREIREQISTLRGGALRRAPIRRHLETCQSCRAFRDDVRQQRAALAFVLPVVPSVALKQNVLNAALTGGSAMGAGAVVAAGGAVVAGSVATGGASTLGSGLVAKGLAVAAIAAGASGGGLVVSHELKGGSTTAHRSRADASRSTTHHPTPVGHSVSPEDVFGAPVLRGRAVRRHGPASHPHRRGAQSAPIHARRLGAGQGHPTPPRPAARTPQQIYVPPAAAVPQITGSPTGTTQEPASSSAPSKHSQHPQHPAHPMHPPPPASRESEDPGRQGVALGHDRSPGPPGQEKKDAKRD